MAFDITSYILGKKSDESGKAIDLISYLLGKASGGGGGSDAVVGTTIVGISVIGG